jgi:hypothetical protein
MSTLSRKSGGKIHGRPPLTKFWGGRIPPSPPVDTPLDGASALAGRPMSAWRYTEVQLFNDQCPHQSLRGGCLKHEIQFLLSTFSWRNKFRYDAFLLACGRVVEKYAEVAHSAVQFTITAPRWKLASSPTSCRSIYVITVIQISSVLSGLRCSPTEAHPSWIKWPCIPVSCKAHQLGERLHVTSAAYQCSSYGCRLVSSTPLLAFSVHPINSTGPMTSGTL